MDLHYRKAQLIALGISPDAIEVLPDNKLRVKQSCRWEGKLINGRIPVKIDILWGSFDISHNDLTSLDNSPEIIIGRFRCTHNLISSFHGGPTVCTDLQLMNNPELISLEHAPYWTSVITGDFENTAITDEDRLIYVRACRAHVWNPSLSWDENCAQLCKADPSIFDKKLPSLEKFFHENRGGVAGTNTGIL